METSKRVQIFSVIAAVLFVMVAMAAGYRRIGLPPVIIVGGSSLVALVMWTKTYLRRPLDPEIILPGFLLTVAALEVHMIEEYLTGFGPAMSRLFDISWTERSFLMVFAFVGPTNANTMRNDRSVQLISNSRLMAGPNPVRYSSIMWTSSAATVSRNPGRMISGSSGLRRYVLVHMTRATRLDPPTIMTGGSPMRRYPAAMATVTNSAAAITLRT